MRRSLLLTGLLVLTLTACGDAGPHSQGDPADSDVVAFVGANVLPMTGPEVLADYTVIVRGDRIVEVGPSSEVEAPSEAYRVDATGRFLMPGIAEMHGHIPPMTDSTYVEDVLFLYVANGVTTVRGMLGHEGQLALRDRVNTGREAAPTLYLAGPGFSGNAVDGPEDAARRVREQHAAGWDLLKIFPGLSMEEYEGLAKAAKELNMPFAGHVPEEVGLLAALELGQQTFDHIDGYIAYLDGFDQPLDEARLAEAVRLTREAGAWIVPTMVVWETLFGAPDPEELLTYDGLEYLPRDVVEGWITSRRNYVTNPGFDAEAARIHMANRVRLLKALADGDVNLLFGTDAPQQFNVPGFAVYREIRAMAEAGISPYEIFHSGSAMVGRYFADKDLFGAIAPGQRADLVLLEANPLDNPDHFRLQAGVMVRGRWMDAAEIRARLDAIAARHGG